MAKITEAEFARICSGIFDDREIIVTHNPLGSREEILLWMLLSVLISYLSLTDADTPCFAGVPTDETYRQAILYVLRDRRVSEFDVDAYLNDLIK